MRSNNGNQMEMDSSETVVSLVTAVYNRENTIGQAVASVAAQSYPHIQHVIIDGASRDRTVGNARAAARSNAIIVSEPDRGIYDALNKGIRHSTGDVIGFVHSDDFLTDPETITLVAQAFEDPAVDAVYGDLDYVSADDTDRVIRHWKSGEFKRWKLAYGWSPPHPALFLRRRIYDQHGLFDTDLRIAADYEFTLRAFKSLDLKAIYIPRVLVKMRTGGASNRSIRNIIRKSREDMIAIRRNGVGGLMTLVGKNLSKIGQFI